jgi:hypothetical protein
MAHAARPRRERLNDAVAFALAFGSRTSTTQRFVWDGGRSPLPGFGLKLTPAAATGSAAGKTWILQYRNRAGASRRLTIGSLATTDAAAARRAATIALAAVRGGRDPQAEKITARSAHNIASLVEEWLGACQRRVERAEAERAASARPGARSQFFAAAGAKRRERCRGKRLRATGLRHECTSSPASGVWLRRS